MTTTNVTLATLENLLQQMSMTPSVLNGWDVVFNLLEDPVNQIFQMQFERATANAWTQVNLGYCQAFPNPNGTGPGDSQIAAYTALDMSLNAPSLQFQANNANLVQVQFSITGTIKVASKVVGSSFDPAKDGNLNDPLLQWKTSGFQQAQFTGRVPLAVVQGSVVGSTNAFAVVLDFPSGSFNSPVFDQARDANRLAREVLAYFASNGIRYTINQVNLNVPSQIPALHPSNFKLNLLTTNVSKNIVQLFITTNGTSQSNLTIAANEPIPNGSNFSLMINRRIAQQAGNTINAKATVFALENLLFPVNDVTTIQGEYQPGDLLVVGNLKLNEIVKTGGDNQSVARQGYDVPGGIAVFGPLHVTVKNVLGVPQPNEPVTFVPGTTPDRMAVQFLDSGTSQATVNTDRNGVATLSGIRVYYDQGPFTVVASVAGGATATFNLTVAPTPPPPPLHGATLTIVAGNNQSAARTGTEVPGGMASFGPIQVLLKDAAGTPVPNYRVDFAPGSQPGGMAVQVDPSGGTPATAFTDAHGIATLNRMGGNSVSAYYAEGPFTVVATVAGGAQTTFNFTVTPTPPPPPIRGVTLSIVSGDGQRVARTGTDIPGGTANFAPLKVLVRDSSGRPAPGVPVNFAPGGGPNALAVQVTPSGGSPATATTDGNGVATLAEMGGSSVRAYYAEGAFTVTASVVGSGQVTFNLAVIATPPPPPLHNVTLTIVSGDRQEAPRTGSYVPGGTAEFGPLQVLLSDASGKPIPNVPVDFRSGDRSRTPLAQVDPSGAEPATVITDNNGVATLNRMAGGHGVVAYYGSGRFTVVAAVAGGTQVTFNLTVTR